MQLANEIDITNDNRNEEPTDRSGFSLMNKTSEKRFSLTIMKSNICKFMFIF